MNTQFKISLVTLILFGITACSSNSGRNNIDKSSPAKSDQNTSIETPNEAQPATTNSTESLEPNKSATTPTITKPTKTEPLTKNLETDSNGIEWRNRKLTPDNIMGPFKTLKVVSNIIHDGSTSYEIQGGDWYGAPLSAENEHLVIDFKKIAEEDGKIYFGVHEGKFSDPTMQGYSNNDGTKVRKKDIDYLFVNQPNTTYGILFDGNTAQLFYQGLYAGKPFPKEVIEFVVQDERNNYRSELKGQATYKGQVLATTVLSKGEREYGYPIPNKPFVDGTVTLTADFGGSKKFLATDSEVKGEINSKTLGKIQLNETAVHKLANSFEGKAFTDDFTGKYSGLFTGPKLEDAVGRIRLEKEDAKAGEIKEYHAVFGGVKH